MMKHLYLDAGAFRDLLSLEQNDQIEDGYGGYIDAWSTVSQNWARILPARADFSIRAEINEADYTHIIDLRQPAAVDISMRFAAGDDTRHFTILAVYDPDETGRYLRCICRKEGESA